MNPNSVNALEKTLLGIALTLVLLIFAGTLAGLVKRGRTNVEAGSKAAQNLVSKGKALSLNAPSDDGITAWFELGRIRLTTAADPKKGRDGSIMVISPWISYPAEDKVFFEELSRKKSIIKGLFSAYFTSRTKNQLLGKTEEIICSELLEEINARLSLGKIKAISFTDYIFLE